MRPAIHDDFLVISLIILVVLYHALIVTLISNSNYYEFKLICPCLPQIIISWAWSNS